MWVEDNVDIMRSSSASGDLVWVQELLDHLLILIPGHPVQILKYSRFKKGERMLTFTDPMNGMFKMEPRTGILLKDIGSYWAQWAGIEKRLALKKCIEEFFLRYLRKLMATGKKPLKRTTNPYNSTHMPMRGHPKSTTKIPPKNAALPLALCHWKKNLKVLSKPMTQARPERNKI